MNLEKVRAAAERRSSFAESDMPAVIAAVPKGRITDLDVREDLRQGNEPFSRIMQAQASVPPEGVLRVRAIFEPVPLYMVLGKQGFSHWTEKLADDDWRVWFYRGDAERAPAAAPAVPAEAPSTPVGDELVILDVRGMEPPEPMARTLEALDRLPAGKALLQVNVRVPQFLLPLLEERGFEYVIVDEQPNEVRGLIRRVTNEKESVNDMPEKQLDVRVIPPREKHPAIFATFDALDAGDAFILINDHDPFPLRYQFDAERSRMFTWDYVEQGPVVWRVRIRKVAVT